MNDLLKLFDHVCCQSEARYILPTVPLIMGVNIDSTISAQIIV
jgi:hypothetical protein